MITPALSYILTSFHLLRRFTLPLLFKGDSPNQLSCPGSSGGRAAASTSGRSWDQAPPRQIKDLGELTSVALCFFFLFLHTLVVHYAMLCQYHTLCIINMHVSRTCRYVLDGWPQTKSQMDLLTKHKIIPVIILEIQLSDNEMLRRAQLDRKSPMRYMYIQCTCMYMCWLLQIRKC